MPRNGTFIQEHGDVRVYEVVDFTVFYEGSLTELRNFFGVSAPAVVPSETIQRILANNTPFDALLLREHSSSQVFQLIHGKPQPIDYACSPSTVRVVSRRLDQGPLRLKERPAPQAAGREPHCTGGGRAI